MLRSTHIIPLHLQSIQQQIHDIVLQEKDSSILNETLVLIGFLQKHLQNSNICTLRR